MIASNVPSRPGAPAASLAAIDPAGHATTTAGVAILIAVPITAGDGTARKEAATARVRG